MNNQQKELSAKECLKLIHEFNNTRDLDKKYNILINFPYITFYCRKNILKNTNKYFISICIQYSCSHIKSDEFITFLNRSPEFFRDPRAIEYLVKCIGDKKEITDEQIKSIYSCSLSNKIKQYRYNLQ